MLRLCARGHGLYKGQRCKQCEHERDQRRGTPSARGYGTAHQRARQALRATLPTYCGYGCGTWLTAESRWVAAHVEDGNPEAGWLVSCAACNEQAKGGGHGP